MKYLVSLLTFLMSCTLGFAQFYQVNTTTTSTALDLYRFNNSSLKKEDYNKLKECTVYVVLPNAQLDKLDEYKVLIDSVWTYSKIDYISFDEYEEYCEMDDVAFLMLQYDLNIWTDTKQYFFSNLGYKLIILNENAKKSTVFANIDLVLDGESDLIYHGVFSEKSIKKRTEELNTQLYDNAIFLNFTPQLLSRYLKSISFLLAKKSNIEYNSGNKILSKLTVDTLFLTENCLINLNSRKSGTDDSLSIYLTDKEIMSKYPYPYKIISFEELESKLANNERFFYAIFDSRSSFCVFESRSVDFLYLAYLNATLSEKRIIKKKMESLAKEIERVKYFK